MSLHIVMGPMFSGKTSWILNQVRRHNRMGLTGLVVKPDLAASRQASETLATVTSHDDLSVPCLSWPQTSLEGLLQTKEYQLAKYVIIDEAQFCQGLSEFVRRALDGSDKDIVLVGLNGDFQQRPFRTLDGRAEFLECLSLADQVTMLHSLCSVCRDGTPGFFTKRTVDNSDIVLVGTSDIQQSVCRKHCTKN